MIDILAEGIMSELQRCLVHVFSFVRACLVGCLGLAAWTTFLALFSPAHLPLWILSGVFLSSAASGYTLTEWRTTQYRIVMWIACAACGASMAGAAWWILLHAQESTFLSVLFGQLLTGLFFCSLAGAWAGSALRFRFEATCLTG